jgi:hypothetical protein
MCLLLLWAATAGCGRPAERKPEPEDTAAQRKAEAIEEALEEKGAEKKVAEQEAAEKQAAEQEAAVEKKAAQDKVAEKKAAEGEAAEKEAAKEKADDDGYVKVKVEVELRGVLSCTKEAATISIDKQPKWVLDFGEDKEMRAQAKSLDGKTVLVKGSAILRGARLGRSRGGLDLRGQQCFLDLEPKVAVKSLVAATKR